MVTHDAYLTADSNYEVLHDQMAALTAELEKEDVLKDFYPLGLIRDYLDNLALEGLR